MNFHREPDRSLALQRRDRRRLTVEVMVKSLKIDKDLFFDEEILEAAKKKMVAYLDKIILEGRHG